MAITACRECKGTVSTEAKACPHCGATDPAKEKPKLKDAAIGFVGLVAIVVLLLATCSDSTEDKKVAAENAKAAHEKCIKDIKCIGDKLVISAGIKCPALIEKQAANSVRWTDGTLESKFSFYRWSDPTSSHQITFFGDKAQFQNAYGAYVNVVYECDMTTDIESSVVGVRVKEGRL